MALDFLRQFDALERKTCDEAGWLALKFSISRAEAEKLLRSVRKQEPSTATQGGRGGSVPT